MCLVGAGDILERVILQIDHKEIARNFKITFEHERRGNNIWFWQFYATSACGLGCRVIPSIRAPPIISNGATQ